jgi:hypothetical protein
VPSRVQIIMRQIIDQSGYGGYQAWSENGFE